MDPMDRPIDKTTIRRRRLRATLPYVFGLMAIIAVGSLLVGWLKPSVRHDRIRLATVEEGSMSATIDATGLVVPRFDQIITAPLATRVARIRKKPGAAVSLGDTIALLDDRGPRRDVTRLQEQIALKENQRVVSELALARGRSDLASEKAIKELELKSHRLDVERNRQLFDMGLITRDQVRKSETDAERVAIELQHLADKAAYDRQDHEAALEGLARELAILQTDLDQAREQLARTVIAADRQGIVTWVVASEGASVGAGEVVARVADLTAFRVDATLSDVLARRLAEGLPAAVRSGDVRLTGRVDRILPSVNNGIVTFEVALDEPGHRMLRPNLRVDVHTVTDHRQHTLRLKRGPLLNVEGNDAVFVLRGDRAVRTRVEIGLSNFEFYEITSGLVPGDQVIISDMSDYRNMQEVKIR